MDQKSVHKGPILYILSGAKQSFKGIGQLFKHPKLLVPMLIMVVLWVVLSYWKLANPYIELFIPALTIGIVVFIFGSFIKSLGELVGLGAGALLVTIIALIMTAGIGLPFVFSQGADPAIAGILALTAGYCGTLLTPMAANFNIVPAAVLETKNKYRVIISQAPFALALWAVHVFLMYTLAF